MPDYYFELRHQQARGDRGGARGLRASSRPSSTLLTGRSYGAVEAYRLEDAERALVCLGSTAGTVKDVVDELRDEGEAVGLLQIRSFRPFPAAAGRATRSRTSSVVIVLDRADSPGGAPPLHAEVAAALYGAAPRSQATSTGSAAATSTPRTSARSSPATPRRYVGLRGEPCPA